MDADLLTTFVVALSISVISQPLLLPMLKRRSILDVPNDRSSHETPTPRGAGVGIAIAFTVACLTVSPGTLLPVSAVLFFFALGLADDLRSLRPTRRLLAQMMLAAVGCLAAASLANPSSVSLWLLVPLGSGVVLVTVNAVNFMDGLNGITGISTGVIAAFLAVEAIHVGASETAVIAVAIGGAASGFLPWNFPKAKVFLGDSGSYTIGAALGIAAVAVWAQGGHPLAVVGMFAVYLTDTGVTLVRRSLRREPVFEAHRTHVYQQLTDHGMSHVSVSLLVGGITAVVATLALEASRRPASRVGLLAAAMAVLLAYVALPFALRRRP